MIAAQAGMAGLNAYLGASTQAGLTAAQNRITASNNETDAVNAAAANTVRSANNVLSAATGSFSVAQQSLGNKQALRQAGAQYEAMLVNAVRQQDQIAAASFEDQIANAEQAGVAAARAGFFGASGSAVDQIAAATALRAARTAQASQSAQDSATYDLEQAAEGVLGQMLNVPNYALQLPTLDYGKNVASYRPMQASVSPWRAAAGAVLSSLASNAGSIANSFQTPTGPGVATATGQSGIKPSSGSFWATTETARSSGTGSGLSWGTNPAGSGLRL